MYTPEMIKVFAAGESDVRIQRALSAAAQREDIFQAVAKPKPSHHFVIPARFWRESRSPTKAFGDDKLT